VATTLTTDAFVAAWKYYGCNPQLMAQGTGMSLRGVYLRRAALAKQGIVLPTEALAPAARANSERHGYGIEKGPFPPQVFETVTDGSVVIFGDAHYWPGNISLAHEAMLIVLKEVKPKLIIANGDIFDGAGISRHPPLGWHKVPDVIDELDAAKDRLAEIRRAAPKARLRKTVGNHDSRFDRRLAEVAPQFSGIKGMSLQDHLRDWPMSYSVIINKDIDPVFVVHNVRNGAHATWNNVKATGCTTVTGHLHDQNERPQTFLLREAAGIDHGCLADVDGPQFAYTMGRPTNWRSGFVSLTFDKKGRMFPAEFCRVQRFENYSRAVFRGRVITERKS
jgi:hypothetical protein